MSSDCDLAVECIHLALNNQVEEAQKRLLTSNGIQAQAGMCFITFMVSGSFADMDKFIIILRKYRRSHDFSFKGYTFIFVSTF